ncbi:alpha/beta hydrolase [Nocardioides sp.]|uniref:alpha/beta fold hydrolase n=1 Tax=Nocardioides sp. TaxID=35761 RepID=UPI00286C123B|nr:alpha/beta hydrolase [Nocardioides sp.]
MRTTSPETLELSLPQVGLQALAWGPDDGPLVVALHGFPDTAWTWRHLGPHLAERGHRVVAPFTRGYGPSAVPADRCFQVGALMADAAALHDVLGGDERAVLVGHDWGAITANGLGAHEANPYRAVVTLAVPPIRAMSEGLTGWHALRLAPTQLRLSWYTLFHQLPLLPEGSFERLVRHLWAAWSPGYDATEDLEHLLESVRTPEQRSAVIGYYRAVPRVWAVPAAYADWHRTWTAMPTVPSLNLHGADDGCLQAAIAERAATRLPDGAEMRVVADAGHFLQLEQPVVVNDAISTFIAR